MAGSVKKSDISSANAFLVKCEALDYPDRVRYVIEVGRQAQFNTASAGLIRSLLQGQLYERTLATYTAFGNRDTSLLLQRLDDPSHRLRSLAAKAFANIASDAQIIKAVGSALPDVLKLLIKHLFKRRRLELLDQVLNDLKTKQPKIFDSHFAFGSKKLVENHLDTLSELQEGQLLRLCRIHPILACNRLKDWDSDIFNDPFLVSVLPRALPILSNAVLNPELVVEMFRNLLFCVDLSSIWGGMQYFVNRIPEEIAQFVIDEGQYISNMAYSFRRVMNRIPIEKLLAIDKRHPEKSVVGSNFKRLSPDRRLKVYQETWRGRCDEDGFISADSFLRYLPGETRINEAQRFLAMPTIKTRPNRIMEYASVIPWGESLKAIQEYIKSSDIDTRAEAIPALVWTVRHEPDNLATALNFAIQRRNEPDPVRRQMLRAFSEIPMKSCTEDDLLKFEAIIKDAFSASDLSHATQTYMRGIIFSLFRYHPTWAVKQFVKYAKDTDLLLSSDGFRGETCDRRNIILLDTFFTDLINDCLSRKKYLSLTNLSDCLRINFELTPSIIAALQQVVLLAESNHYLVTRALLNLRDHPKVQKPLLLKLFVKDPTWLHNSNVVSRYILHRKQSLLNPGLVVFKEKGVWNPDGQVRVLLLDKHSFPTWTPKQQDQYAQTLFSLIQETGNTPHNLSSYVKLFGHLNYTNRSLENLSTLISDARPVIRDVAIRTLPSLDEGKRIPVLVECFNDDRARIAIYAFNRVSRQVPPTQSFKILASVPMQKVTVAKQVYRLIASLGTDEAFNFLLEKEKATDLHVDVRIAILTSLWDWVSKTDIFPIFEQALRDSRKEVPIALVTMPLDPSPAKNDRLIDLISYALEHAPREVGFCCPQKVPERVLGVYQ